MNIQEKAKAYDEALKRAKELLEIGLKDTRDKRVVLSFFPELKENEDEKIIKSFIRLCKALYDVNFPTPEGFERKDMLAWLEKQGNKSQGKSALEAVKEEKVDNQNCVKPTDNVEPKFHEGEWIVFNGLTLYVKEVVNGFYRTITKGGITNSYYWGIDNVARLWTIQDAKDGDVLACNEEILLFKSYSVQGGISLYCWYNGQTNNFHNKEVTDTSLTTRNKICPATKEQRGLLFQKMKESGYEWDAEKKELKKIGNKNPLLSDFFKAEYERGKADAQKPTEWSEEDAEMLNQVIEDIVKLAGPYVCYYKDVEWLKSLKDRVRLQKQWKPSVEQLEALESATENCAYSEYQDCLRELIEKLKKLKE